MVFVFGLSRFEAQLENFTSEYAFVHSGLYAVTGIKCDNEKHNVSRICDEICRSADVATHKSTGDKCGATAYQDL
jgi:hypothetical protein